MYLGFRRMFVAMAFFALLFAVSPCLAQDSVPDTTASDSTLEIQDSAGHSDDGFKWSSLLTWPFNHIFQPVLNALIYPVAMPFDYAFKNGIIEKSVDLITFGSKKNIFVYPAFNLKPGASTLIGANYRHRNLFQEKDYLVLQANFYANSDVDFGFRYTKHSLFGTPFFGGIRYDLEWNRDDHFVIPETKSSYLQPDSSMTLTWRLGTPLSKSLNWNAEIWTSQALVRADVPDVEDSLWLGVRFPIENRGLYQDHMEFPIGVSVIYDNLDFPYAPSRGTRISFSASYHFVGKYDGVSYEALGLDPEDYEGDVLKDGGMNHDYIRSEFLFQYYFLLGKSENFILSATEARQNRKFYTDFSWDEAIRVWRPENVMQTLFERRVLAFQYRLIDLWEMEEGGAPFNAFPYLNARTPLRGYGDSWTSHHIMSFSMEYRWPVDRFVDGVLFNEYALISEDFWEWERKSFYNSWGFGIRVRQPNMYLFRMQLGFHGLHGVNLIMTIAPEFK